MREQMHDNLPIFFFKLDPPPGDLHSFPTRRSSDLRPRRLLIGSISPMPQKTHKGRRRAAASFGPTDSDSTRSEEHTSELQSRVDLVCRLLLEKKKMAGLEGH